MARKVIKRNIAYDDVKRLYYVNMDYGKNIEGKRVKMAKTFKRKKDAEKALRLFEADKAKRTLVMPAQDTFESFAAYWLAYEKADKRETTLYSYSSILRNHILPYFGKMPLQGVSKEDIYKYFAHLRDSKNLSANSIRKHYDILTSIFNSAELAEKLYTSPTKAIRPPKISPYEGKVYEPQRIIELFLACQGTRIETAIHLAVYLGLRRGEICGLKWTSVDFDNKTISIVSSRTMAGGRIIDGPVKSDTSERKLKIPDGLFPALRKAKSTQDSDRREHGTRYTDSGYVLRYRDGKPYRPNYLSKQFARLLERSGLPHIRFHDLRHTHGSIAILGAPLYDVSRSLGHSRQEVTQRIYIKDMHDVKSAAVDSVDGTLKAAMVERGADFVEL